MKILWAVPALVVFAGCLVHEYPLHEEHKCPVIQQPDCRSPIVISPPIIGHHIDSPPDHQHNVVPPHSEHRHDVIPHHPEKWPH